MSLRLFLFWIFALLNFCNKSFCIVTLYVYYGCYRSFGNIDIEVKDWNNLLDNSNNYYDFINKLLGTFFKDKDKPKFKLKDVSLFETMYPLINALYGNSNNFKNDLKLDENFDNSYCLFLFGDELCLKNFGELFSGNIIDFFDIDKVKEKFNSDEKELSSELNIIKDNKQYSLFYLVKRITCKFFKTYYDDRLISPSRTYIEIIGKSDCPGNIFLIPDVDCLKTKKTTIFIDDKKYEIDLPVILYYNDFILRYSEFLNGTNINLFNFPNSFEVYDINGDPIKDKFTRIDGGFKIKTVRKHIGILYRSKFIIKKMVNVNDIDNFIENMKNTRYLSGKKHKIEKVIDNDKTCPYESDEYFSNRILVTILDEDIPSKKPIISTKNTTMFKPKKTTLRHSNSTVHSIKNSTTPINTDTNLEKTNHRSLTPNNRCCCKWC